MASPVPSLPARLNAWLNDGQDPDWERPGPTPEQRRADLLGAVLFLTVALGMLVATKSMGMTVEDEAGWRAYLAMTAMIAPLTVRRRFPLLVLVAASALFVTLYYLSPEAGQQLTFQTAYFTALYTAVAWARDRRLLWLAMVGVLLAMVLWLVASFTLTSGYADSLRENFPDAAGPLDQMSAAVLYAAALNLAYFGGAILIGRTSWRAALQRERLVGQAERIHAQSVELARRAVVDERLRIARELHDVVAHHVSVIGVQAGAARTVLTADPAGAAAALQTIESASRDAVGEMRTLLGVLRSETQATRTADRAPEPGLADLPALADAHREHGLDVRVAVVEERPGDVAEVSGPVGLSLYRTVQESLANVLRHSTARQALVAVRTGTAVPGPGDGGGRAAQRPAARWVEVEVVDDGVPRPGTEGSGYGLRGIRERVQLHGGEAEVGPRETTSGWRVRVRLPMRRQP